MSKLCRPSSARLRTIRSPIPFSSILSDFDASSVLYMLPCGLLCTPDRSGIRVPGCVLVVFHHVVPLAIMATHPFPHSHCGHTIHSPLTHSARTTTASNFGPARS